VSLVNNAGFCKQGVRARQHMYLDRLPDLDLLLRLRLPLPLPLSGLLSEELVSVLRPRLPAPLPLFGGGGWARAANPA
jgi:hypothetical protein